MVITTIMNVMQFLSRLSCKEQGRLHVAVKQHRCALSFSSSLSPEKSELAPPSTNTTNADNKEVSVVPLENFRNDLVKTPDTESSSPSRLEQISKALEEITGVHEIAALKQTVVDASDRLESCTQQLQNLRQQLDQESLEHQDLATKYAEMMAKRHEWTEKDVTTFAQLTAAEGKARSAVDATRQALQTAETAWQDAQTSYLDAVRQRYHEEQVWHDKWRVLGTYWTWTLIGLNSVVFVVGQALHYRRETLRMQSLQDMIRPLTIAAQHENEARQQQPEDEPAQTDGLPVSTVKSIPSRDAGVTQNDDETAQHHSSDRIDDYQRWKTHWSHWTQSTGRLTKQTFQLMQSQTTAAAQKGHDAAQKWLWKPCVYAATQVSHALLGEKENDIKPLAQVHWPSAAIGAATAGLGFVLYVFILPSSGRR